MREFHRRLVGFLRDSGAEGIRLEQSSRHPRLCFTWEGRSCKYICAGSPSDGTRAVKNAIADLRRRYGLGQKRAIIVAATL